MSYNIIDEYINFIKKEYLKFYKIILRTKYNKQVIEPLLDRYIMVRYYNETIYASNKDVVERINKELSRVIFSLMKKSNEELLKNIYALFGYIMYYDDCFLISDERKIADCMFHDDNIKLEFTEDIQKEILNFLKQHKKKKDRFHELFLTNQFHLKEEKIANEDNLYLVSLMHHIKMSNLYSEYAILKAYNEGIGNEDKSFVLAVMLCERILQSAINLFFNKKYILLFPETLFGKPKKLDRFLRIFDNTLAKKQISLQINYQTFLSHKEKIIHLMRDGYSFSLYIDSTFDQNYQNLVLFQYILVPKENEYHDDIIKNKEMIDSTLLEI